MYQVYVERENSFAPDMIGEFKDFKSAQAKAHEEKEKEPSLKYRIEKTNGAFNSYGERLTTLIEEG